MHTTTTHQLDQDQDLLTELRILSSLRPHDRISTNNATKPVIRIQKPEFFRSAYRFFGSESRVSNVAYLQSLMQRTIDRYSNATQIKDDGLAKRLKTETQNAILGIRRLQHTYEDDAQFQASLNISVDTVCIHLGIQPLEMVPMSTNRPRQTPPPFATLATATAAAAASAATPTDSDADSDSEETSF
jgi:hypothetical protein